MGGAWERLIRSVKTGFTIVLKEHKGSKEVLYTDLTEIEHSHISAQENSGYLHKLSLKLFGSAGYGSTYRRYFPERNGLTEKLPLK